MRKELKQTAHVLDREVAEKMKNYDAVQQAAVTRLEREHKRQDSRYLGAPPAEGQSGRRRREGARPGGWKPRPCSAA